jgi:ribulose-bisphosphate carboxylase large chain
MPVMAHPSFTGSFVLAPMRACAWRPLRHAAAPRRADISVFPNVGGRFGFSEAECRSMQRPASDPRGPGALSPQSRGGMSVDRAAEMQAMYGEDVVYLLGGSLLRHGERIGEEIARMRRAIAS